ncbi:hypothetical protein DFJ74DRAFT_660359 [Hyaloraphidium curvatum]|nr:hypothetical protein DFJ74DRAFT_660359 [Hyaloraphidium curvatum]
MQQQSSPQEGGGGRITKGEPRIHKSRSPTIEIPKTDVWTYLFGGLKESEKDLIAFIVAERVDSLAKGLKSILGVRKGDVIAVFSPNAIEFGLLSYAALKIGAIIAPCNPTYNSDELEYLVDLVKPKFVFTRPAQVPTVAAILENVKLGKDKVLMLAEEGYKEYRGLADVYEDENDVDLGPRPDPEDTAFICFSSGTSGKAKGVELRHRNIVANSSQVVAFESGELTHPGDVFDSILPYSHVYALTCIIINAMKLRATVLNIQRFNFENWLRYIQDHKVTFSQVAPPILVSLSKSLLVDKYDVSSLKVLNSGAAPLGADTQDECSRKLKVPVKQGYGMTESSPVSHVTHHTEIIAGSVGKLLPNMEARLIVPDTMEDAKEGEAGELWMRGPNIMKSYFRDQNATASTIVEDGWLRTGDIAKIDGEGNYFIVDRLKELIKWKGFQVPPAELEELILQHPFVADCAVIGIPAGDVGELPKAFVVLKQDAFNEAGKPAMERSARRKSSIHLTRDHVEADIASFVADRTAHYKHLRGGVEVIPMIPKSAAGKILRRVLRLREQEIAQSKAKQDVKPREEEKTTERLGAMRIGDDKQSTVSGAAWRTEIGSILC